MEGRIVTHEKTGAKAWWDGEKLTPIKIEGNVSESDIAAGVAGKTAPMDPKQAAGLPPPPTKPPITQEDVKRGFRGIGRFAAETALPLAGSIGGGMIGSAIPMVGTAGGAMAGGMLGEAATQALGIKDFAPEDVAITGAMEAIGPGVSRLRGPLKAGAKRVAEWLPGASMATKQPLITRVKSLPSKFLPKESSKQLYGELEHMGNVKIDMPTTVGVAKELEGREAKLMPKYRSPTIEGASKEAEEFLGMEGGVDFSVAQDHLRRLGDKIRVAESGQSGENLGALKQMRSAIMDDMTAAEKQFPALKRANQSFKQEQAVADLKSVFESATKAIPGKSGAKESGQGAVREFNAKSVLDKFNQMVNPKNADKYDRLFTEGLGEKNIKEIRKVLQELNEFGPISVGWSGGGSLVAQGAVAGAGAGLAGLALGGEMGGLAGLVGGLGGAAFPHLVAEALMRRPARAFLLRSLKSSGGKIKHPDQFLAALGSVIQRSPTIFDEE